MTEMTATRVAGFLGLCVKAGQVSLGQEACVNLVRREAAALVLLDEGCSENTRKRLLDACQTHQVPLYSMPEGRIAQAVGKEGRMMAAIGQGGMAQKLFTLLSLEPSLSGRETSQA